MSGAKWRFACASVIGAAHLQNNTECQDSFVCETIETDAGEILIAAIADGAGSTTHGRIGAETACRTFFKEVSAFLRLANSSPAALDENFGALWLEYFQMQIAAIAARENIDEREFAATFAAAVVGATESVFYCIGDTEIVFARADADDYDFAVAPAETLYVNMTDFLTDENAREKIKFRRLAESVTDLILFSDGVSPVAVDYQTNRPHAPFFKPMLAPLKNGAAAQNLNEKLANFLASPKINEKSDDDKTLILASRKINTEKN